MLIFQQANIFTVVLGVIELIGTSILLANSLKIVSGGQTGADRAALDWAIANQIRRCCIGVGMLTFT